MSIHLWSRVFPWFWYALLTIAVTWPLILSPGGVLGALHGPGDPYLNFWILGWDLTTISRAPLDLVTGRAFDANIFHPARQTLAYSDHLSVVAILVWPVYFVTGSLAFSYNAVLLGSLFGSAMAMHAFARTVTGSRWGALVAGTIWGFWPYRVAHLEHLQLQALYAMPLAFLCLHRFVAGARRRDAVALGAAAAFQAATSVYYGLIGTVGLLVGFAALLATTGGRRTGRLVRRGALAAIVGAVLIAPLVWPYWQVQEREGFTRNLYEASRHAAAASSYASVSPSNALYGATGVLLTERGAEHALFPGVVTCVLGAAGLLVARRRGSWPLAAAAVAVAATGFVLSFGPDGVRPLYATLHRFVFGFQAIRAPARFAVLVTFGLATLAAIAIREIELRGRGSVAAPVRAGLAGALVLALIAIEYASVPLRLVAAPAASTAVGRWLSEAPGPGAVLYLPLSIDLANTPFMVDSLEHRRPIVNGYSGQRPGFFSGVVDAFAGFPSVASMWMLKELDVRFVVAPAPIDVSAWPLVDRARLADPHVGERWIYELAWSPEVEARLGEPSTPVPPAAGPIPFRAGERLTYDVTWDGPTGTVKAGTVVLSVGAPAAGGRDISAAQGYTFTLTATTAPWIARFFEADDRFVTTTDDRLFPQRHERVLREGRRRVNQEVAFDLDRLQAQPLAAGQPAGPATRLWPQARDAVSAFYFVRTLALAPGSRVEVPIFENSRHTILDLRVVGEELRQVAGRAVPTLQVAVHLRQRVARRRPPEIRVWLERDGSRALVAAEVSAVFGNLRVELAGRQ